MQHVVNILSVYHKASRHELEAGLRWYLTAHEEASRIGKAISTLPGPSHYQHADERTFRAAAIIAALSPGLKWERNIEAAERIIAGEGLEGLGVRWYDGVKKGRRILSGEYAPEVLKGNKVVAFCNNIAEPQVSQRVCVDGHAYAIWEGQRVTLDDVPPLSDTLYTRIEADYRAAAELSGLRPLQMQAITWTTWRRLHGVSSAHYLPLFEDQGYGTD